MPNRISSVLSRLIGAAIVAAFLAVIADAQIPTASRPDRGVSAINSYSLSDIERITSAPET